MAVEQTRFANFALGLDATFCSIVGLIFTLTGAFMADWLGVAGWLATVFGLVVMAWSLVVTLYANRRVTRRPELDRVIGGNLIWIIVAAIILVIPGTMTSDGKWLLAIGTAIVVLFVIAQTLARRSLAAPGAETDSEATPDTEPGAEPETTPDTGAEATT